LKSILNFISLLLLSIYLFFACTKPAQKPGPAAFSPLMTANFDSTPWVATSFNITKDSTSLYIIGINDTSQIYLTTPLNVNPGSYRTSSNTFAFHYYISKAYYIGDMDSLKISSNSNSTISGTFNVQLYSRFGQAYKKVTKGVFNVKY